MHRRSSSPISNQSSSKLHPGRIGPDLPAPSATPKVAHRHCGPSARAHGKTEWCSRGIVEQVLFGEERMIVKEDPKTANPPQSFSLTLSVLDMARGRFCVMSLVAVPPMNPHKTPRLETVSYTETFGIVYLLKTSLLEVEGGEEGEEETVAPESCCQIILCCCCWPRPVPGPRLTYVCIHHDEQMGVAAERCFQCTLLPDFLSETRAVF